MLGYPDIHLSGFIYSNNLRKGVTVIFLFSTFTKVEFEKEISKLFNFIFSAKKVSIRF